MEQRFTAGVMWWLATTFACPAGLIFVLANKHRVAPGPGLTLVSEGSTYYMMDFAPLTIGFAALLIATLQGLLQWLVIRKRLAWAGWWVAATAIGVTVGMLAGPPSAGFVLGLLQCVSVLFRVRQPSVALLWIPVSGLAWLAGAVVQAVFPAGRALLQDDHTPILGWSVGWAAYALVTAIAFALVLVRDEEPTTFAARSKARPLAASSRPRRASSPAPSPDSRLQGWRFFAAWLLVGAFELLLAELLGPQGWVVSVVAALAQGFILQLAFGVSMLWQWALATLVGGRLGAAFGTFAAQGIHIVPGTSAERNAVLLASLVFGTAMGLVQWVVLRRARSWAWLWIPTAAAGIVAPSLLGISTKAVPSWVGGLVAVVLGAAVLLVLLVSPPRSDE
jgi:hypothetical protein